MFAWRNGYVEKLLYGSYIGHAHFLVSGLHFQTVTNCHGFVPFGFEPLFVFTPIDCCVHTFCQHSDYIDDRDIPFLSFGIPDRTYFLVLEYFDGGLVSIIPLYS